MADSQTRLPPNDVREFVLPLPRLPVDPVTAQVPLVELASPRPLMPVDSKNALPQEPIIREYPFTGAWLPGPDPLVIGAQNYTVMQNLRYRDGELQSVLGYTVITPNSHPIYGRGRSGIQFHKLTNAFTISILLVQAYNFTGTQSAVLVHTPQPPAIGEYNFNPIHIDAPLAGLGRFSLAPNQQMAYANGREVRIWGGEETRIAAFYASNAGRSVMRDYTEEVSNISQESGQLALLDVGGPNSELYLGTTRPAQGFKFYVTTPNAAPLNLVVRYWGEGGWTTLGAFTDTTSLSGIPFAQTGTVSFPDTQNVARPRWFQDQVLYFYHFEYSGSLTGGTAVHYATANLPWQPVRDVWDGIERKLIFLEVIKGGAHKDYTLEALEAESSTSSVSTTTGEVSSTTTGTSSFSVPLGGLNAGDSMIVGFSEPVMGLRFKIGANPQGNGVAFRVQFWDGRGYSDTQNFIDDAAALGRSGVMHWTPPREGLEFRQLYGGLSGYFYTIRWSGTLSSEVDLDQILGIAKPRHVGACIFPFSFHNRLLLCGDLIGNRGHMVEYSAANAPDVWNGEQGSAEGKQLFFGDGGTLTAAAEIYNRYANSLAYLAVFTKNTETWLLTGNSPDSFQIFPVSKTIGCPAPLTMDTAEVVYSGNEEAKRQVALWLSAEGPVAFDGSVVVPIPGLEPYFQRGDPRHINMDAIVQARGWFEREYKEYNLTFPSGTSTTNNVHVVYDLRRSKWFEKTPSMPIQEAFRVIGPTGLTYTYGLIDSGHMLRLEDGYTWGGAGIRQVLETADILPDNSTFSESLLRYFRMVLARGLGSPATMSLIHYANSELTGTALPTLEVTGGASRLVADLTPMNRTAISHRLRFEVTTFDQQLRWLLWGGWYERVRQRGR